MPIRDASEADAHSIAHFLQRIFTQTYTVAIPAATLARYLAQEFSFAALALKLADPNAINLVAEANATLIAFSRLEPHPVPHHPQQANAAELTKFYVDADFQGRGVAAQLLRRTFEAATQRGWRTLWLCVWEHNPRAIAFYKKHGFVQIGHTEVYVEDIVFRDLVMTKNLYD